MDSTSPPSLSLLILLDGTFRLVIMHPCSTFAPLATIRRGTGVAGRAGEWGWRQTSRSGDVCYLLMNPGSLVCLLASLGGWRRQTVSSWHGYLESWQLERKVRVTYTYRMGWYRMGWHTHEYHLIDSLSKSAWGIQNNYFHCKLPIWQDLWHIKGITKQLEFAVAY